MRKIVLLLLLIISAISLYSQNTNPKFDQALATSLGADEYGMKSYVLVILKSGSNKTTNKDTLNLLFRGHMSNIQRLAEQKKLVIAGPLGNNDKNYRGIFIFNVKTLAEAKELLITDPAVQQKLFDAEMYEWYGSAALPEYLKTHEKIEKIKP